MPGGKGNDKKTTPLKKVISAVAKLSPRGKAYAARAEIAKTGQSATEKKMSVAFVDEKPLDYSSFGTDGVDDQPIWVPMNRTNPGDTPVSNSGIVVGLHRMNHSVNDIHNATEIPIAEVEQAIFDGNPETTLALANFHMDDAEQVEIGSDGDVGPLVRSRPGSATLDLDELDELAESMGIKKPQDYKKGDGNWGEGDGEE